MPHQIGDSIVSAIQEVEISSDKNKDEKQLEPDQNSLLLESDSQGEDISIRCVVIDGDVGPIEERVNDLEGLVRNQTDLNYINYQELQGRISVDSVSFSNSSSVNNLREVDISGKFLPFPKYFPEEDAVIFLFLAETNYDLEIDGEPIIEIGIDSNLVSELSSSADINSILSLDSNLDSSMNTGSNIKLVLSIDGSLLSFFSGQGDLSNIVSFNSSLENNLSSSSDLLIELPIDSILQTQSSISGSIEVQAIFSGNVETNVDVNGSIKTLVLFDSNVLCNLNLSGELYIPAGYGVEYGSSYGG